MGLRTFTLLFLFLFAACVQAHEKILPLEHAIMYEPVSRVQQLLRAGEQLTVRACEYAGVRTPIVQLLYAYFRQAIDCYRAGAVLARDTQINLSREQVHEFLNILLLHANDVHDVRELLLLGADASYVDTAGHNALFYARQRGHEDTVRILEHENKKIYERLLEYVQEKKLTKDFLETYFNGLNRLSINRAYAELDWHSVLYLAVQQDYYEGVKLLLAFDALGTQEVLSLALRCAGKKVIRLLIDYGARLYRIPDFLSVIVRENLQAPEIVKWLAPITSYDQRNCALITACLCANESLVQLLLAHGASAVYEDDNGVSALLAAIVGHNLSVVRCILGHNHTALTDSQREITKTLFPAAYEMLIK